MNLSATQLRLIELLGDKSLSFGCLVRNGQMILRYAGNDERITGTWDFIASCSGGATLGFFKGVDFEILGHVPNIGDLQIWLNKSPLQWQQDSTFIRCNLGIEIKKPILYDSSKDLIDQSKETLQAIISLIESVGNVSRQ